MSRIKNRCTIFHVGLLAFIVSIFFLNGCSSEDDAWKDALEINQPETYMAFAQKYPQSEYYSEAIKRGNYFEVIPFGTGTLDLPDIEGEWVGPIIKVRPQWDSLFARLDDESIFAVNEKGDTLNMLYFVPVELSKHEVTSNVKQLPDSGQYTTLETWIPPINT
ncbi:MAG: hypothetical protein GWN01_02495, partial [Nitrosopumilaceae archaeon]|nr:hypothetical protein [Nitrosopumilaceae archaeon]NIU86201.1 hypothetical protein [Nitrosopumilaceae archaeon]NIX60440.1 hypothetical protein [Nitrosopumilaceae archaeon]